MLTPKNFSNTPNGMWRFKHPDTGQLIGGGFSLGRCIAMVNDYCKANGLPPVPQLEKKIIEYICSEEPNYCVDSEPPTLLQRAKTFSQAAVDWVANGMPVVTHEQYEKRLSICQDCHYWLGQSAVGLGSCRKCGCSGLKLYMSTSVCPDNPPRWNKV